MAVNSVPWLCCFCAKTTDLRPYGPGGALICFPCMKASPDREAKAKANFGALLNAAEAMSPIGAVLIGADVPGPQPLTESDLTSLRLTP